MLTGYGGPYYVHIVITQSRSSYIASLGLKEALESVDEADAACVTAIVFAECENTQTQYSLTRLLGLNGHARHESSPMQSFQPRTGHIPTRVESTGKENDGKHTGRPRNTSREVNVAVVLAQYNMFLFCFLFIYNNNNITPTSAT